MDSVTNELKATSFWQKLVLSFTVFGLVEKTEYSKNGLGSMCKVYNLLIFLSLH